MGAGLLTFAMSTGWPFCNMGVITMKMISNTSITSTIGVTLMSELTFAPSFRFVNAIEIPFRCCRCDQPVVLVWRSRRPALGAPARQLMLTTAVCAA